MGLQKREGGEEVKKERRKRSWEKRKNGRAGKDLKEGKR